MDEGFWTVLDQVRLAWDAIGFVLSDPLIAGGVVAGAVALGAGAWLVARRFGWRPVPSVSAAALAAGLLALRDRAAVR